MGLCNDCGSSKRVQLAVLFATLGLLPVLLVDAILTWADAVNVPELFELLTGAQLLVGLVIFWTLVGPRCCAPCCCKDQMPDVPIPWPYGDCSSARGTLLDYPLMLSTGGDALGSIFRNFLFRHSAIHDYLSLVWLIGVFLGLAAGTMRYFQMREHIALQNTPQVIGQPVYLVDGGAVAVGSEEACPKVGMAVKDRMAIPKGYGMIELHKTSGEESAFEMVTLLYQNPDVRDGLARSQQLQKKVRDDGSDDKMIVYIPDSDLEDLKQVWCSQDVQEARKNVMKDANKRAPRLTFFYQDGSPLQ